MFAPHHLPFLIKYFDGIDAFVARKMTRPAPPGETTLTEEFCAMMDAGNQRAEGLLSYDLDALNADLASNGYVIDADFQIQVHPHARGMEAYVSQADFGLILEVENRVLPEASWSAAYLMQAKRLFANPFAQAYDLMSSFRSSTGEQDKRIRMLASILGEDALKYCLYCPQTTGYEATATAGIRTIHATRLGQKIFDFACGLALHDHVLQTGGVDAGIWVAGSKKPIASAFDLHHAAFHGAAPFTWFILEHFDRHSLWRDEPDPASASDRVMRIAQGDRTACQELIDELGDQARKAEISIENLTVLPASTVTIRIQAGPPETRLPRRQT